MAGTVIMVTEALRVYCLEIHGRYSLYGYRGTASVLFGDTWQLLLVWVQSHCECVVWRYMTGIRFLTDSKNLTQQAALTLPPSKRSLG